MSHSKAAYRTAARSGEWPVELDGYQVTQDELAQRIVQLHASQERYGRMVKEYTRLGPAIELRLGTLDERSAEVDHVQAELAANVELVALSQTVDEFTVIREMVNSLFDMNNAIGKVQFAPGVDRVVDEHVEVMATKKSFEAIMQEP